MKKKLTEKKQADDKKKFNNFVGFKIDKNLSNEIDKFVKKIELERGTSNRSDAIRYLIFKGLQTV